MGNFKVILFLISITVVSCTEYVPVLLWSSMIMEDSYPEIPALSRISSNEFTDYLLKKVKVENPMILVFMEENLSVEDFSWKDLNGNGAFPRLSNVTKTADEDDSERVFCSQKPASGLAIHCKMLKNKKSGAMYKETKPPSPMTLTDKPDFAFYLSVHDPYKAIKKLKNHGYSWRFYEKQDFESLKDGKNAIFEIKLDEPDHLEDRPDMLKRHDEKIAKIYNEALAYRPNVMVIYTGSHTSWIDPELGRFKREDKEPEENSVLIISDENNVVRMSVTPPILFQKKVSEENKTVVNITKVINATIKKEMLDLLTLRVRFNEDIIVEFNFTSRELNWWTLDKADIPGEKGAQLKPSVEIGAPSEYSFFCNPEVVFSNGNFSLTFTNFQVQPRVGKGNSFGPIIHCVPFFSIGILSGLAIVFILSIVLAWGITMIMDINTNDRFDDPKGKTITITATD